MLSSIVYYQTYFVFGDSFKKYKFTKLHLLIKVSYSKLFSDVLATDLIHMTTESDRCSLRTYQNQHLN